MADSGVSKDLFPPGIHMNCRRSDPKRSAETHSCFYLLLTCACCDHSLIRFRERAWMQQTDSLKKKELFKIHCALKTRRRVLNSRQASCKENSLSTLIRTIMVIYRQRIKTARTICFSWCFVSFKYAFIPRSGQNIIQKKYYDSLSCTSQSSQYEKTVIY